MNSLSSVSPAFSKHQFIHEVHELSAELKKGGELTHEQKQKIKDLARQILGKDISAFSTEESAEIKESFELFQKRAPVLSNSVFSVLKDQSETKELCEKVSNLFAKNVCAISSPLNTDSSNIVVVNGDAEEVHDSSKIDEELDLEFEDFDIDSEDVSSDDFDLNYQSVEFSPAELARADKLVAEASNEIIKACPDEPEPSTTAHKALLVQAEQVVSTLTEEELEQLEVLEKEGKELEEKVKALPVQEKNKKFVIILDDKACNLLTTDPELHKELKGKAYEAGSRQEVQELVNNAIAHAKIQRIASESKRQEMEELLNDTTVLNHVFEAVKEGEKKIDSLQPKQVGKQFVLKVNYEELTTDKNVINKLKKLNKKGNTVEAQQKRSN